MNNYNNFEQFSINNSYWNRYNDVITNLSNEQKNFVSKQKSVIQAKQNLMSTFIDYLFEQNKGTFIMASDSAKKVADDYISAIEKASNAYVSRSEELEKENIELKKQIQQLLNFEGDVNGNKSTTK